MNGGHIPSRQLGERGRGVHCGVWTKQGKRVILKEKGTGGKRRYKPVRKKRSKNAH